MTQKVVQKLAQLLGYWKQEEDKDASTTEEGPEGMDFVSDEQTEGPEGMDFVSDEQTDASSAESCSDEDDGLFIWEGFPVSESLELVGFGQPVVPPEVQDAIARMQQKDSCRIQFDSILKRNTMSSTVMARVTLAGVPAFAKIGFIYMPEDKRRISELRYEREIMRRFPNEYVRLRLSPNFVLYYGTLFCPMDNQTRTLIGAGPPEHAKKFSDEASEASYTKFGKSDKDPNELTRRSRWAEWEKTNTAKCAAVLLMESIPKMTTLLRFHGEAWDRARDPRAVTTFVQLFHALHVMKETGLIHFDLHAGNVAIQRDTRGTPFHNNPVFFVVPAETEGGPPLVLRVDATDALVRMFDWDLSKTVRGLRTQRHVRTERDDFLCELYGRCDENLVPEGDFWRDAVDVLRSTGRWWLYTDEERAKVDAGRPNMARERLESFWGEFGLNPRKQGRWWWDYLREHLPFWEPLRLLYLAARTFPELVVREVPEDAWAERTFWSPRFDLDDRRRIEDLWSGRAGAPAQQPEEEEPRRRRRVPKIVRRSPDSFDPDTLSDEESSNASKRSWADSTGKTPPQKRERVGATPPIVVPMMQVPQVQIEQRPPQQPWEEKAMAAWEAAGGDGGKRRSRLSSPPNPEVLAKLMRALEIS